MRSIPRLDRLTQALFLTLLTLGVLACGQQPDTDETPLSPAEQPGDEAAMVQVLDSVAESYVKLVLAVGQHDADYVDAYYGPPAWRSAAETETRSLEGLSTEARALVEQLTPLTLEDQMLELRRRYLARQLESLIARVEMLGGAHLPFDEESKALYDATAPHHSAEHFEAIISEAEAALAAEGYAEGTFTERLAAFRKDFIIPPEKLNAVFSRAIEACRERTAVHLEMPPGEDFVVEYVNDKPWSGYNWYQGEYKSLIQVNTDLPIYIDRAIDLACHEGYPGHHMYNALLEKHLVRDRGWVELSVYPLFSPQSLIAEGSANYGIEMAFPGAERVAFETAELFPLAGLDPARGEAYYRIQSLAEGLSYAGNEAARRYLDGEIDADEAAEWLSLYAAMEPERAQQRVRFIKKYRSYVINYNLGLDLVRQYVEREAGDDEDARWRVFGELLSSPRLPSDLQ